MSTTPAARTPAIKSTQSTQPSQAPASLIDSEDLPDDQKVEEVWIFISQSRQPHSYISPKGTTVFFYEGFHKTQDKDTATYLRSLPEVREATGKMDAKDVPVPPPRKRNSSWASADKTMIQPHELLNSIVRTNSANMGVAAQSNS